VDGEGVSDVVCRASKEFLVGGPLGASSWLDAFCDL
jgi:hypothetical protein